MSTPPKKVTHALSAFNDGFFDSIASEPERFELYVGEPEDAKYAREYISGFKTGALALFIVENKQEVKPRGK